MKKIINIFVYVIIAVTVIMTVYFFLDPREPRAGDFFIWAYILLGLGIVLMLVLPLFNIGANPKMLKKAAMSIVFMVVLFGIAYMLASGAQTATTQAMMPPPSEQTMRITDTGIYATYILLIVALFAILFGSVYAGLKKR